MLTIGEPGLPTFQTHWRLIDLHPDISYKLLFLYFLTCKGMNILTSEFADSLLFVCCQYMQRSTFFYYDFFRCPKSWSWIFFFSFVPEKVLRSGHGHLERLPRRGPDSDKPFALLPLQHHRESREPIFEIKLMHKDSKTLPHGVKLFLIGTQNAW